jgi:hypothetical protein
MMISHNHNATMQNHDAQCIMAKQGEDEYGHETEEASGLSF